eukprot:12247470-Prorocentrum_lima.AAC.1
MILKEASQAFSALAGTGVRGEAIQTELVKDIALWWERLAQEDADFVCDVAELPAPSALANTILDLTTQVLLAWSQTVGEWNLLPASDITHIVQGAKCVAK